jgi:hypothetical protein
VEVIAQSSAPLKEHTMVAITRNVPVTTTKPDTTKPSVAVRTDTHVNNAQAAVAEAAKLLTPAMVGSRLHRQAPLHRPAPEARRQGSGRGEGAPVLQHRELGQPHLGRGGSVQACAQEQGGRELF